MAASPPAVLAYGFPPFFLVAVLYAALSVLAWTVAVLGGVTLLPVPPTSMWHAHEMLYGFVPAIAAGFLLTAISNWTGVAPLAGWRLAALVGLWLAGCAVMGCKGLIALIDGVFLPVLTLYVAAVLLRASSRRNLGLVAVLAFLSAGNGLMQAGMLYGAPDLAGAGRDGSPVVLPCSPRAAWPCWR